MTITIYKLTFKNGKIYVGQTALTPEDRSQRHIEDSRSPNDPHYDRPICVAIREHGAPIMVETLESDVPDEPYELRFKRENYWICELKSNDSSIGYNAIGGNEFSGDDPEYMKQYYVEHKEEMDKYHKQYAKANREAINLNQRKWRWMPIIEELLIGHLQCYLTKFLSQNQ